MRWIFLAVFSLNLVYVAWQVSVPDEDAYANVKPLKNVKPIVLLGEMKRAKAAEMEEAQAAEALESEVTAKVENKETSADVEGVTESSAESVAIKTIDKAKPVATASVVTKPKAVVAAAQEDKADKEVVVESAESSVGLSVGPSIETSCFTLGPFRDLDKLRGFTREIKAYVTETDFRGREETEQSLYWVFVDPEKTRKKAVATGKQLKAKKIKDFYLIREGEKRHGLSLGHFRNKDGAYGLAKKVRKLGFNVTVEPVFKTYTIYWLDYRLSDGAKIPQSVFDKHIKPTKKEAITRLNRDCSA